MYLSSGMAVCPFIEADGHLLDHIQVVHRTRDSSVNTDSQKNTEISKYHMSICMSTVCRHRLTDLLDDFKRESGIKISLIVMSWPLKLLHATKQMISHVDYPSNGHQSNGTPQKNRLCD